MRFLVDAQLPPALARWLSSRGLKAEHVFDRDLTSADDRTIWRDAETTGSIVITKDEDFAVLKASSRQDRELSGSVSETPADKGFFSGSSGCSRFCWRRSIGASP